MSNLFAQDALVVPFENLRMSDVEAVGGKNASLGEMISQLPTGPQGVRVPTGFATTAHAFRVFLAHDGLHKKINTVLDALDTDDVRALAVAGSQIRALVEAQPFPADFEKAVRDSFATLSAGNTQASFAVRSSATAEDLPDASFAGQQETFLNVVGIEDVLHKMKEVFASLYNDRAISYRVHKGFAHADVALSAGESISDLLNQLKEKVVAAKDGSLKTQSRQLLDNDFKALLRALSSQVSNAAFDGGNLLNGSLTSGIQFLANADASSFVTLTAKDLSLGGTIIELALSDSLLTLTGATQALTRLDDSITQLNAALGSIGAQAKQIEAHNGFVSKLMDTLESGIGNLVDADLAKESARLQALQVQQQLGAQSLSIANQAPQALLSLFR